MIWRFDSASKSRQRGILLVGIGFPRILFLVFSGPCDKGELKMRWFQEQKLTAGTRRNNRGFLFLPKTIKGETRWLEKATWEEAWVFDGVWGIWIWEPLRWLD